MSHAFLQLWNFLKRPAVWLLTIFGTVATAYFTPLIRDMADPLLKRFTQHVCEFRKPDIAGDDSRFTVLISPLSDDANNWHTTRVIAALRTDRAFRPIVLCESLSFDHPVDPEAATEKAIERGSALITENKADLLIFGKVVSANNLLELLAINEHGGCERRPKPNKGDYDAAIKDYDDAIRLDPKSGDTYGARANVYYIKRDYAAAIVDYDQAIRLDPKSAVLYNNRGAAYFDKDDYDRAVADYSEAIRLDPNDASFYGNRGRAYWAKDNNDQAIADYDAAIRLAKSAVLYKDRGNAYYDKDDYDRAIADYGESIRLDPNDATTFGKRGNAYRDKKDYDRAFADYGEAIRLDPNDANPHEERGFAYFKQNDYSRAVADYDAATALDPKLASSFRARAFIHVKRGELDLAIRDYDTAVQIDPKNAWGLYGRSLAKKRKGDRRGSNADLAAAKALQADVATAFARAYGE